MSKLKISGKPNKDYIEEVAREGSKACTKKNGRKCYECVINWFDVDDQPCNCQAVAKKLLNLINNQYKRNKNTEGEL